MATRRLFIERALRQIYGGEITDDSTITFNLVNTWLEDAIGIAVQANQKANLQIDGVNYINNSFYTRFRGISISSDGVNAWKLTLPQIPMGVGATEGVSKIELTDGNQVALPVVMLTENQSTFYKSMRPIPNKIIGFYEGEFAYIFSSLILTPYTANVTMISGGDSTNLDSTLNVPPDYWPVMVEYIQKQLMIERNQPVDNQNDGVDTVRTT